MIANDVAATGRFNDGIPGIVGQHCQLADTITQNAFQVKQQNSKLPY